MTRYLLLGLACCATAGAQQPPRGPYEQGLAHHAAGRHRQAVTSYSQALQINPRNIKAWNNRAICRVASGDLRGAMADYTRCLELDPAAGPVFFNRALARQQLRDVTGAFADYTRAVTLTRRSAPLHLARGTARQQAGDLDGARRDYRLALAGDEQYAEAYYNLATVNHQQGMLKGAEADYRAAVKHATPKQQPATPKPDQPDPRIARLVAQLGSPVWKTRNAAHQALIKIGKPAAPALTKALESKDAEVKSRARQILDAIARASNPSLPAARNSKQTLELARQALAALKAGGQAPKPILPPPLPSDLERMRQLATGK